MSGVFGGAFRPACVTWRREGPGCNLSISMSLAQTEPLRCLTAGKRTNRDSDFRQCQFVRARGQLGVGISCVRQIKKIRLAVYAILQTQDRRVKEMHVTCSYLTRQCCEHTNLVMCGCEEASAYSQRLTKGRVCVSYRIQFTEKQSD